MVSLNFDIDASNAGAAQSGGYSLIPEGEYRGDIVDVQVKQSKTNAANSYLELQIKIEGHGSVWDRLNIWNSNPKAAQIAKEQLTRLGMAIGVQRIGDTDELIAKPVRVHVGIEAGKNGYADKNKVLGYMPVAGSAPRAAAPAPAAPASAPVGAPPWASA